MALEQKPANALGAGEAIGETLGKKGFEEYTSSDGAQTGYWNALFAANGADVTLTGVTVGAGDAPSGTVTIIAGTYILGAWAGFTVATGTCWAYIPEEQIAH